MNYETLPVYTETESASIQKMDTVAPETRPPPTQRPVLSGGSLLVGPEKTVTMCPFCNTSVLTTIKHTTTTRTHLNAVLCCLICCCCCIPYCCDSAKNTDHYCPNCSSYLGTYQK